MTDTTTTLDEVAVRELGWVADVIDAYANGSTLPTSQQGRDLAEVIRRHLPKPEKRLARAVKDKYGTLYERFAGGWYYVQYDPQDNKFYALRVPFSSIQEPVFLEDPILTVVE